MKSKITFILPTLNRRDYVIRAVESCLRCETEVIKPYVLVIDGESDDGSFELLLKEYGNNPQVKLTKNKRTIGFQQTAFNGALQIKSDYATFMYDDDILSPYYGELISHMVKANRNFVMGYGKKYPVEKVYPFNSIKLEAVDKNRIILAYFGHYKALKFIELPVSPICCVVKKQHLQDWVRFTQEFAKKNNFRKKFMIKQNIGPDLILFLSEILKETKDVLLASSVVGQFSYHGDSMSVKYGTLNLSVGYWIARIWAFEKLCDLGSPIANLCGGYLITEGMRIMAHLMLSGRLELIFPVLREIFNITVKAKKNKILFSVIKGVFISLKNFIIFRYGFDQFFCAS